MSYEVPTDSTGLPVYWCSLCGVLRRLFADFLFDGRAAGLFLHRLPVWCAPTRATGKRPLTGNKCVPTPYWHQSACQYLPDANQPPGATTGGDNPWLCIGDRWRKRKRWSVSVMARVRKDKRQPATSGDNQRAGRAANKSAGITASEAQDQGQALPWNQPPERDRQIAEGMQSVNRFGDNERKSQAYRHPQSPLNFTFQEREYQPQTNGAGLFPAWRV